MTIKAEIGKLYTVKTPYWAMSLENMPPVECYTEVLKGELFLLLEIQENPFKEPDWKDKGFYRLNVLLANGRRAFVVIEKEEFNHGFKLATQ